MGAPTKRAKRIRQASEFDPRRLAIDLRPPKQGPSAYSWSLDQIYSARTEQMLGRFRLAARLAESMRTDDAIFTARTNRLAPQIGLEVKMVPAKKQAEKIAGEADALFGTGGVGLPLETLVDIHGYLVDHGVAFGVNTTLVRPDGSRTDYAHRAWPIEWVRWDPYERAYKTQTESGVEETIVHGDGRWVIYSKNEIEPFKHGTIVPGSLVWARHAFGVRDWAKGSAAHGNAKVVGEMPAGVPLQEDGAISPEAAAFLELLKNLLSSDFPFGIRPAGSKTDFLSNASTAWQVFAELVKNAETAAARIYLGTDGTLGANGGAPGVDIQALFGVAATLVEGDLECIERGIKTGVIDPWCATNFGSSELAPTRKYMMPDADADAVKASFATRNAAFWSDVKAAREAGYTLTQEDLDALAADHGVRAPRLPTTTPVAPPAPAPALRRAK